MSLCFYDKHDIMNVAANFHCIDTDTAVIDSIRA